MVENIRKISYFKDLLSVRFDEREVVESGKSNEKLIFGGRVSWYGC